MTALETLNRIAVWARSVLEQQNVPILTISVISLAFSWMALQTSRQSMKAGQRAYVDIENSQVHVQPLVRVLDSVDLRIVSCTTSVKNTGNTPAKFTHLEAKIVTPEGWTVINPDANRQKPGRVGPRSDQIWTFAEAVR